MNMKAGNARPIPGISSALHVPVMHGSKEAESAFLVHLVCLVCLVFWLNETKQMNQINQINKTNQVNLRQVSIGCEEKWNSGRSRCAAFCSRGASATVVIRVSLSCSFGLYGSFGLSGFLVERNKPNEPNKRSPAS